MSTKLGTETREKLGSRHARRLRGSGRIPVTLQGGPGRPHLDLSIDEEEFLATRRHHEHLYDLEVGGESETALVEELQWDVFGERLLHVEFRRVDRHQKTEVDVPLEFVGHPKGGLVNHLLTELTVRALPDAIPDGLEISVAELAPGDSVHASDVTMPEGVELVTAPDALVAVIAVPRAEVVEKAPEEAAPAEAPEEAEEGEAEE